MSEQEILDHLKENPLPDKVTDLNIVRKKAVELRDLQLQKAGLEQQILDLNKRITDVERHELIDLFDSASISSITVDADGNYPAFIAARTTVYGSKKPTELESQAYDWFEESGHGDLVKAVITILFGMQEHEERLRVMKLLSDANVQYSSTISIHNSTLKAFVKRELQAGRIIPMDLLGAYVFDEVKIK